MILPPTDRRLSSPSRRTLLFSMAGIALSAKAFAFRQHEEAETVYRFATPACEVQLSIEHYGNSELNGLHFRDFLSRHAFCLSAKGEEDSGCVQHFAGSLAIAHYRFRTHHHAPVPVRLRERVHTIDYDSRLDPRPVFEKLVTIEQGIASDIQAFGYDTNDASAAGRRSQPLWYLSRQDLFLDDNPAAFLIVHWKHSFDSIQLLDIIPGDGTELLTA